jgi:hypothetical protein
MVSLLIGRAPAELHEPFQDPYPFATAAYSDDGVGGKQRRLKREPVTANTMENMAIGKGAANCLKPKEIWYTAAEPRPVLAF